MNYLNSSLFLFLFLSLISCQPEILERIISESTIDEAISVVLADSLLKENAYILREVNNFSRGREVFRDSTYIGENEELVGISDFQNLKNKLFNYFKENNVKYIDLINQQKLMYSINVRQGEELKGVFLKIQDECLERQKIMDEIQNMLNNSISFKVINLQTRYAPNTGNFVEFTLRYDNKTNNVINASKVFVTIYDGFGNKVFSSNISGSDPFRNSIVRYLSFYENRPEDMENYRKFERKSISGYKVEYDVRMLNIGGQIIPSDGRYSINLNEKYSEYPMGYCFYIGDEEPLMIEKNNLEVKHEREKQESAPHLIYVKDLIDKATIDINNK